ncbi:hypothetical protein [uncultured Methanobrevibacter sp.]|uniref:hypothetical protein n=1 Tax=uncultured Methanobrevibacter sp. TaxID=253161 RepID=UPI0025DF783F|nr:hypothetical protein [uncultured Methanobrevibacter sp.]
MNNRCPIDGALFASSNSNIDLLNCRFEGNSATNGAAITADNSCNLVIGNSSFLLNNAKMEGGAVYIKDAGLLSIQKLLMIYQSSFESNTAQYNGGAIYVESDERFIATIVDSVFTENSASNTGGALYIDSNADLTFCNFTRNSAGSVGGAYLGYFKNGNEPIDPDDENNLRFTHCIFIDNQATSMASDLYIDFQMDEGLYVFQENYVKSIATHTPAIYLHSSVAALRYKIKHNSFIVPRSLVDFCFMKMDNMHVDEFNENWWGRNFSYDDIKFNVMLDRFTYDVGNPLDRRPLHISFGLDNLEKGVESEIKFVISTGTTYKTLKTIKFFPFGVNFESTSPHGAIRVGPSSKKPSWKSVYFTPNKAFAVNFTVTADYQTLKFSSSASISTKNTLIWFGAGFGAVLSVIAYEFVSLHHSDDGSDNESDDAYYTIEDAINAVGDGCAIIVPPGVYRGLGNVGLNINKNIIIMSDPNQTGDVVIDAEGKSGIWNISASNFTVLGLTFINGQTSDNGAALNFNAPLDNSTIVANFINNNAANGGAIYFDSTGGNISYSKFVSNVATYDGGAVYFSMAEPLKTMRLNIIGQTVVERYSKQGN